MSITPRESALIRRIEAINATRPGVTRSQQSEWERLVTEHEDLCRSLASGPGTERRQ
jgi:hypothetical protein